MAVIEACIDKEGNTGLRDLFFLCPCCKSRYDDYDGAQRCLLECAQEEWGYIEEVVDDIEPEYIED